MILPRRVLRYIVLLLLVVAGYGSPLNFSTGIAVQENGGISPALAISQTSLLLSLEAAFSQTFSIMVSAGAGYSYLYISDYPYHWFHFGGSLSPVLSIPIESREPKKHFFTITPLGLYVTWAPGMYLMAGPELTLGYRFKLPWGSWDIVRLGVRALLRDTVFDYKWHFQASASIGLGFGREP